MCRRHCHFRIHLLFMRAISLFRHSTIPQRSKLLEKTHVIYRFPRLFFFVCGNFCCQLPIFPTIRYYFSNYTNTFPVIHWPRSLIGVTSAPLALCVLYAYGSPYCACVRIKSAETALALLPLLYILMHMCLLLPDAPTYSWVRLTDSSSVTRFCRNFNTISEIFTLWPTDPHLAMLQVHLSVAAVLIKTHKLSTEGKGMNVWGM